MLNEQHITDKYNCFLLKRRGRKTILKSGQGWTLLAQLGQMKTGQDGKGLL